MSSQSLWSQNKFSAVIATYYLRLYIRAATGRIVRVTVTYERQDNRVTASINDQLMREDEDGWFFNLNDCYKWSELEAAAVLLEKNVFQQRLVCNDSGFSDRMHHLIKEMCPSAKKSSYQKWGADKRIFPKSRGEPKDDCLHTTKIILQDHNVTYHHIDAVSGTVSNCVLYTYIYIYICRCLLQHQQQQLRISPGRGRLTG